MRFAQFHASLAGASVPAGLSPALQGLWHDARGDWDRAHRSVQADDSPAAAWVHAYLHRKEGDASNAAYWYRRAGRTVATGGLGDEWTEIARALLAAREGPARGQGRTVEPGPTM